MSMTSNNNVVEAMAIPPERKHGNSGLTITRGRRGTHNNNNNKQSCCSSPVNSWEGFKKSEVSARKLAAGLWEMQFMKVSTNHAATFSSMSRLANGNAKTTFPHYHMSGEKIRETKDQLQRPIVILHSRNGLESELESSMPRPKVSKEMATKWNPILNRATDELTMIYSRKIVKDKKLIRDHNPFVTALLEEQLLQTQRSINKLKAEHKSMKKNVEQFLHNLKEESIYWKQRQRHKMKAILDDLKGKLERERRSRETTELLNSKLIHELAEANSLTKQFMTNYEKEKKEREVMEEVCEELAMQIGEDKARLKATLSNSKRVCEEVEEERKMMQMAELWREERVQMKLVDAQLVLQDKYNELQQLAASLQMFFLSKGAELDAEWIKQQVGSVNIQGTMQTI